MSEAQVKGIVIAVVVLVMACFFLASWFGGDE